MKRFFLLAMTAGLALPVQANFFAPRKFTYHSDIQAESYEEAYEICKEEVKIELKKDLEEQRKYNIASYHSDKYEIRELIKADCDRVQVADHLYNKKARLKLGEICTVDDNALMKVRRLVPDELSVGDPNWNKTRIEEIGYMSVVTYPCRK